MCHVTTVWQGARKLQGSAGELVALGILNFALGLLRIAYLKLKLGLLKRSVKSNRKLLKQTATQRLFVFWLSQCLPLECSRGSSWRPPEAQGPKATAHILMHIHVKYSLVQSVPSTPEATHCAKGTPIHSSCLWAVHQMSTMSSARLKLGASVRNLFPNISQVLSSLVLHSIHKLGGPMRVPQSHRAPNRAL